MEDKSSVSPFSSISDIVTITLAMLADDKVGKAKVTDGCLRKLISVAAQLYHCDTYDKHLEKSIFASASQSKMDIEDRGISKRKQILEASRRLIALRVIGCCHSSRSQTIKRLVVSLYHVMEDCHSALASLYLAGMMCCVAEEAWGHQIGTEHSHLVQYEDVGVEKFMGPLAAGMSKRCVVKAGQSLEPQSIVSPITFAECDLHGLPFGTFFGLTLGPPGSDTTLVTYSSWRTPRRSHTAAATTVLYEFLSNPTLSDESSFGDLVDRSRQIGARLKTVCRLMSPRCRGSAGGRLKLKKKGFAHAMPPIMKGMLAANSMVVKCFERAEEQEEILLGTSVNLIHAAYALRSYAKLSMHGNVAERAACMLAAMSISKTIKRLPLQLMSMLMFVGGDVRSTLETDYPYLVDKWCSPSVPRGVQVPYCPSVVQAEASRPDPQVVDVMRPKRKKWSRLVDQEISALD